MRLIDADALVLAFYKTPIFSVRTFRKVRSFIRKAPTIEAEPVKHGRWVEREDFDNDVYYDCSVCRESFCFIEGVPEDNFYCYCPNCGARMDGE